MAVYINYGEGEADATVQGKEWLQSMISNQHGPEAGQQFDDRFETLRREAEHARNYDGGPIFDLFVQHCEDLFSAIPEGRNDDKVKEVESFFALLLSMLLSLNDTDHLDRATTRLCEILRSSVQQYPEFRLRLLMSLYNAFSPTVHYRHRVFKYTIDYAAEAGLFDLVMPYLEHLDAWMSDWSAHLTDDDRRTLFRDISNYTRALNKRVDAFLHLKRYHQLFQGASADQLKDQTVQHCTIEFLKDAVQLASVIQFDDILSYDTVKALAKTPHGGLVQLCEVFHTGTIDDLRQFHKKNQNLFAQHELELQEAMSKIKLLTLATKAQNRSELSLAEVAESLEESEETVEPWVVRAISEGILDGRIDQLNHKVLVKSAFQRTFAKNEWAFLDTKLSAWIDNLESVIKFIGEQKQQSGQVATVSV